MPNKKLALVDIDNCLLQKGQLNLALVEKLKKLHQAGYTISLFTQRNRYLLQKNAQQVLSHEPEFILYNPLATTAGILKELKRLGLKQVRVSSSMDFFTGKPYRYYQDTLQAFETALHAKCIEAAQADVELDPSQFEANNEAERQHIIDYLGKDSGDSQQEAKKVAYLKAIISHYINSQVPKEQGAALWAEYTAYSKAEWLAVAETIANEGLALSEGRMPAASDIYLPVDKNQQLAWLEAHYLATLKSQQQLQVVLFDDAEGNHRDIQAFKAAYPNDRVLFTSYLVEDLCIVPLEDYPAKAVRNSQPDFYARTDQHTQLLKKILAPLTCESIERSTMFHQLAELAASEDALDQSVAQQAYELWLDLNQQQLEANRLALKNQPHTTADDAASLAPLQRLQALLEQERDQLTGLKTRYVEALACQWCTDAVDEQAVFRAPTYILDQQGLYFIDNFLGQGKSLNRQTHLLTADPELLQQLRAQLPSASMTVSADMQSRISAIIGHKPLAQRRLATEMSRDRLRIVTMGCSGKEPNVLQRLKDRHNAWDARARTATSMEHLSRQPGYQTATLAVLLGDQGYTVPVNVQTEVLEPYQPLTHVRCVIGNHELGCEGRVIKSLPHVSKQEAMARRSDYVRHLQEEQKGAIQPRVQLPAPYYFETVYHPATERYQAFLVYIDSNLLPIDLEQQQWLQTVCAELDALDPQKTVPRFLVGHHSLLESVDKRGVKAKESQKYANAKAQGNQHQILAATLAKLAIPVQDYVVLASHVHGTSLSVRGPLQDNTQEPIAQLVFGDGGSYSNKDNTHTFVRGVRFISDAGFGPGVIDLAIDQPQAIKVAYHDSDQVLSGNFNPTYALAIDTDNATANEVSAVVLPKVLLNRRRATLDFLQTVASHDAIDLLSWPMRACYTDIQAIQQQLALHGVGSDCFTKLMTFSRSLDKELVQDLLAYREVIEQCLRLLLNPIQSATDASAAIFLPLSNYQELYKTLQTYQAYLQQWYGYLWQADLSRAEVVEKLSAIFITPRDKVLSDESQYLHDHKEVLESDDEDDEHEVEARVSVDSGRPTLVVNPLHRTVELKEMADSPSDDSDNESAVDDEPLHATPKHNPTATATLNPELMAVRRWRHGRSKLTPELEHFVVKWLQAKLNDAEFLASVIAGACREAIEDWHRYQSPASEGKPFSRKLLPFLAAQDSQLALIATLLYLIESQKSLTVTVFNALMVGIDRDQPSDDWFTVIQRWWQAPSVKKPAKEFRMIAMRYLIQALLLDLEAQSQTVEGHDAIMLWHLLNQVHPAYKGNEDDQDDHRRHACLSDMVKYCLVKKLSIDNCFIPLLAKTAVVGLWAMGDAQQQLAPMMVKTLAPKVVQLGYLVWQEQQQQAEGPLVSLAHSAMLCEDEKQFFSTSLSRQTRADATAMAMATELHRNPAYFAAFKALLTEAKALGWLSQLPEPVPFVPENERETIAVGLPLGSRRALTDPGSDWQGSSTGLSSTGKPLPPSLSEAGELPQQESQSLCSIS